jgi:hypothetical protein
MKRRLSLVILAALLSCGLSTLAQLPGSSLGLSRNVSGTLTIGSISPASCPTLVCTTNITTNRFCYTNCSWRLVCTTNSSTGQVQCTNVLVCNTRCFTNVFPELQCTNVFLTPPTRVKVRESLTGAIVPNAPCDELDGLFPANAVFQAIIYADLRTNDWRGSHLGSFTITAGTNVVARGSVIGSNGVGSHRGLEPCALCGHLEGTLRGFIVESGVLQGASIQATYVGNLTDVVCPSANAPQGSLSLSIDGVTVVPCARQFRGGALTGFDSVTTQ